MIFSAQSPKVLIVDDEPANLKVMREILGEQYRLSFAKSGTAALTLLEKELPKLILLDIMTVSYTHLTLPTNREV